VELLKVGATIGVKEAGAYPEKRQLIKAERIKSVIETVIGEGIEAEVMRKRAKDLKEKAKAAMEEGGSSYLELGNLIKELIARRNTVSI
jgi:scopoletin glucosyltransferase